MHQSRLSIEMVIGGCFGIAVYNSIEVYISICRTFRRKHGLYFWSAIAANTGIPIASIAILFRLFDIGPIGPMTGVYVLGWWLMVTGQSLVLYSRLHLVMTDPRRLHWILFMIIADFFIFHVSTSVALLFISIETNPSREAIAAFDVIEKTHLVVFTLQETLLSGLYVYEASGTLKPMAVTKGNKVRRVFQELIALCVVIVGLDISLGKARWNPCSVMLLHHRRRLAQISMLTILSLVITQFTDYWHIQTSYKPVVYSIKLKVEAFVLNNLIALVKPITSSAQLGTGLRNGGQRPRTLWWLQADTSLGLSGSSLGRDESPAALGGELLLPTSTPESNRIRAPMSQFTLPEGPL